MVSFDHSAGKISHRPRILKISEKRVQSYFFIPFHHAIMVPACQNHLQPGLNKPEREDALPRGCLFSIHKEHFIPGSSG
jgi:hypothetical protein